MHLLPVCIAGIYVSRNTYLRQGIVEWQVKVNARCAEPAQ